MTEKRGDYFVLFEEDLNNLPDDGFAAVSSKPTAHTILTYYPKGIFPWHKQGNTYFWFCPEPRWVLYPENIRISKSMRRVFRKGIFEIRTDTRFSDVICECAHISRKNQNSTWIDANIIKVFEDLYALGYAHSVEVYKDGVLVGGLYGLAIGEVFFGESMFSRISDASKVALIWLCRFLQQKNFHFIDCQAYTPHLESMGAQPFDRKHFLKVVSAMCMVPESKCLSWTNDFEWFVKNYKHEIQS